MGFFSDFAGSRLGAFLRVSDIEALRATNPLYKSMRQNLNHFAFCSQNHHAFSDRVEEVKNF